MSKKLSVIIFMFIPTTIGYFYNILFTPTLASFLFYILPIFMFFLWFWVGGKFAQMNIKVLPSILVGNSIGIVSLIVYLWQFGLVSEAHRSLTLAGLSQMFSASTGMYIVRIAILIQPERNVVGHSTNTIIQILGLILMIIIFTIGYYFNKRKVRL
ncbi:hypothetical protein LGK97_13470 [Clostridium sp. CS001]|uniref:hypothetical protein n=1 Tax=Clostridium sp. CS001 TaxID=2880648 RepID=UPI001CF4645B|nr:hypothetical protein [Clostridium sp. CS001]MCB2290750.1 hypothetical protein [Clostridium sp. CS001]